MLFLIALCINVFGCNEGRVRDVKDGFTEEVDGGNEERRKEGGRECL